MENQIMLFCEQITFNFMIEETHNVKLIISNQMTSFSDNQHAN